MMKIQWWIVFSSFDVNQTYINKMDSFSKSPAETNGQGPRVTFDVSDDPKDVTPQGGDGGGEESKPPEADNKFIVETFPAVLVSGHQDAFLRFWSAEVSSLQWRHMSIMTSQINCFNCSFGMTTKKISKLRIAGPFWRRSNGDSPHKGPVMWKAVPCHDVITVSLVQTSFIS